MNDFVRHDLPADITVLAGDFASQPLVFAHLLDVAPDMDLSHVEVIQSGHAVRLRSHFDDTIAARLADGGQTLVLILPAAHPGLECPVAQTEHLRRVGSFRGTVPHLRATQ